MSGPSGVRIKVKPIRKVIYENLFGNGEDWKLDVSIRHDGNCFFECIAKALTKEYQDGWSERDDHFVFTPQLLRDTLAATVTKKNYEDMVRDYVVNAPTPQLAAVYNTIKSPDILKIAIRSSLHYATVSDIRMMERLIETHIIIVNGIYNPTSENYAERSPIYGHCPDRAEYDRYIILMHGGEHFELIFGSDYRMMHSREQIPSVLRTLYENTMVES